MPSTLCSRCKFLYLSAESLARYGFTEVNSETSGPHLQFPAGQHTIPIEFDCRDDLPDLPALGASGEAGCSFCPALRRSLLNGISERRLRSWSPEEHDRKYSTVKVVKVSLMAEFRVLDNEKSKFAAIIIEWDLLRPGQDRFADDMTGPDGLIYFKLRAHSDDPLARYLGIAYPHPDQDRLSTENTKTIRDHLAECDQHHNHASSIIHHGESIADKLPLRLIEITQDQEGEKLRLVETKDLNSHGSNCQDASNAPKYAALSYRWGSDEFLATTPSNLQAHYQDIPLSPFSADDPTATLPPGFRDVVDICCALGISYLWIDSLCIIQKETRTKEKSLLEIQQDQSRRDWASESTKMHSIYMSSYLTIYLTATDTPLQKVFDRPVCESKSLVPITYSIDNHPGIHGSFFIEPSPYTGELDHLFWNPYLAAEDELDSSVWNTRGWTLQERLLSPRKLYIGVTDMLGLGLFTCPSPKDHGRDIDLAKRPRRHKSLDKLEIGGTSSSTGAEGPDKTELYKAWYKIVEDYTCRDLTVPSDKLPAVAGIARTHALALNDEYLVGLWVQDLASGLLWATRNAMSPGWDRWFGERERRPMIPTKYYRAPTWSWCANDGAVEFLASNLYNSRPEIEVLGHDIVPQYAGDSYGQLAVDQGDRGYVKLRAKIRAARMEARFQPIPEGMLWAFPGLKNRDPEEENKKFQLRYVHVADGTKESHSETIFLDHAGCYLEEQEVYLMIVSRGNGKVWSEPVSYEDGVQSAGLVLLKCPHQTRLQFKRIGFYEHFYDFGLTPVFDDCEPQTVYLV
ncbi:HET-domain-containing protein [Aspergillus neoniger CBS 115656]|uniref:HET-domain-containing protein n=1 Tax=Aspergillus neoniger (strain CBS 115656) TaxID=1448310 RepID=A0A318YZ50_ASPNB|nr:HET-domain-containing protein [Aspergillus neoniger CBS 115656]PYH38103.1 HET-domain-containing protein [Aspergillus neoniger CBS 115656]